MTLHRPVTTTTTTTTKYTNWTTICYYQPFCFLSSFHRQIVLSFVHLVIHELFGHHVSNGKRNFAHLIVNCRHLSLNAHVRQKGGWWGEKRRSRCQGVRVESMCATRVMTTMWSISFFCHVKHKLRHEWDARKKKKNGAWHVQSKEGERDKKWYDRRQKWNV